MKIEVGKVYETPVRSNPDWDDLDDPFLLDDDDIAFCHLTLEQYLEQHDLYEHDDP